MNWSRGRREAEPETRVGHCCGCGTDGALFKLVGIFRYRCAACFVRETGYRHHLSPSGPPTGRIVLP
jgi:hypothetical protein